MKTTCKIIITINNGYERKQIDEKTVGALGSGFQKDGNIRMKISGGEEQGQRAGIRFFNGSVSVGVIGRAVKKYNKLQRG